MSIKDFKIISRLGEGSFASVWKVVRLSDNQEYALKKVNMRRLSDKEKENALNEVRILASIQSPFVIGYKEAFFDDDSMNLCIVMELANGGDIQGLIQKHIKHRTYFPEQDIWQFAIQILKGMKTLHEKKIIHRDLKTANVFVGLDGKAKIGDLNVSKVTSSNFAYTQAGTPYYASPEIWRGQPYDARSDIWSLGCIIYEMAALKPPFRAKDLHELYNKVIKGAYDRIPYKYSYELANIISTCLKVIPSQRPTCEQLLNHPSMMRYMQESQTSHHQHLIELAHSELIKTIKVPKNMRLLGLNLPKPNYSKSPSPRSQRPEINNKSNLSDYDPNQNALPYVRVNSAGAIQPQEVFVQPNFILQPQIRKNNDVMRYENNIGKDQNYQRRQSLEREEEFLQRMRNEYANQLRRVSPIRVVSHQAPESSEINKVSNNIVINPRSKQQPEIRGIRMVTPEKAPTITAEKLRVITPERARMITPDRVPSQRGVQKEHPKLEEVKPSPRVMKIENPSRVQIDQLAIQKKRYDPNCYITKQVEKVVISQRKRLNMDPLPEMTERNDVSQEYQPNEKLKKPYVELYSRVVRK